MKFAPFLLDQWLQQNAGTEFNLAVSTGPQWTVRELLALEKGGAAEKMLDVELDYSPTAGSRSLREAIAEMRGVAPEEVIVFAGGAEALFHIFYFAMETGANVVIPFPNFPAHETVPQSLGFDIRRYELRRENGYRMDVEEVKQLADQKTKIMVVNSPHNPTGATLSDEEMRELHDFAAERGIQFVSDEVYHPIYHRHARESAARLESATVVGDFSKALSLAGLRLGWIVERDSHRRREYSNAREYLTISNTPVAEFLGEIAIRHHEQVLRRAQQAASTNLALLDRLFSEHGDAIDWVRPEGGMTGFARLVSGGNAREFCEAALERGLLLAPGDCWGIADRFRIGFGVGVEWYPRAMARLSELLGTWNRRAKASVA